MMNERFFGALRAAVEAATAERAAAAGLRDVPIAEFAAGVTALACGLGIERSFGPEHRVDEVMATMLELLLVSCAGSSLKKSPE